MSVYLPFNLAHGRLANKMISMGKYGDARLQPEFTLSPEDTNNGELSGMDIEIKYRHEEWRDRGFYMVLGFLPDVWGNCSLLRA